VSAKVVWTKEHFEIAKKILGQCTSVRDAFPLITKAVGRVADRNSMRYLFDRFAGTGQGEMASYLRKDPVSLLEMAEERSKQAREKKQVSNLVEELRTLRARQAFIDTVASYKAPPKIMSREKTSGLREMTAVVLASDWHVEEPVEPAAVAFRNEYNMEIAAQRVERFFRGIIWNIEHHRASKRIAIRDLVLWLGGDLMTGYIHPELMEMNALSPTETVRWLIPRLRDGIATVLEQLGLDRIVVPCSYGNHGRTGDKPRVSTGYANSYEWLMYHMIAREFEKDKRVYFEVTDSAHQYVQVYDWTLHFHHGDEVKYMGGVGGLGIPLLKAVPMWDRVKPSDVHNIGHHHTLRDFGRAVANGSLIGFGAYSQKIHAEFEVPQQAMYYMDKTRGKSMMTALWVAESNNKTK
jgi:hypothetical protein